MNDISLTGCFLNDIQSPGKATKHVVVGAGGGIIGSMSENSRDSIFLNVTILYI